MDDPKSPLPPGAPSSIATLWRDWAAIRDSRFPVLEDFPFDPLVAVRPGLALIERAADSDSADYRFVRVGPDHRRRAEVELAGKTVRETSHPQRLSTVLEVYARVFDRAEPHYWELQSAPYGRADRPYARLLLPLFAPDGAVSAALGDWVWSDD